MQRLSHLDVFDVALSAKFYMQSLILIHLCLGNLQFNVDIIFKEFSEGKISLCNRNVAATHSWKFCTCIKLYEKVL